MIGVLNYGMGNIKSVVNAIDFVGYDVSVIEPDSNWDEITHLIIPGVGGFSKAMSNLLQGNLIDKINNHVSTGKPTLGICLGMQVLSDYGDENGGAKGLGLISGTVAQIDTEKLPVPHVGWNSLIYKREHPIFQGVKPHVDFYFVHSFYFISSSPESTICTTNYGSEIGAVIGRDNIVGVQFHPEKSQDNGLRLLENFCDWNGKC